MIELPTEWLMVVPMIGALVLFFAAAAYYSLRAEPGRTHGRHPSIYRCSACARVYINRRQMPMVACPRCGNMNPPARR